MAAELLLYLSWRSVYSDLWGALATTCEEVVNKTTVQFRDLSAYYIDLAKEP